MMLISKGHFRRSTALLIVAASAAAAGTAQAQTPAQTQAQAQSQNQDHIVLGVGVAATPAYQGSDETRIIPIPAIDIREGWLFANLRNGVGVIPISTEHFEIGASAVFVQGYRGKDVPDGIDRLSDGVGARLFTNIRAGGFVATLGAVKIVSGGTKGTVADASISYPINISSRFTLTPTVGTTWADRKYNDRYFGVTPTESLASGLPEFGMGGGFKDVSGMLTASYRLTDRITLSATGGVTSMIGDAADSPLVEKKTQPSGIFTLTYRL
ncbi:MipA/OmpV family protein [Sphingobium sp. YR768]|uniref:MipA/OmpV family protein n=1 Tax=Sphingobium sp. YR768 TaxID=1884365 RepID=UPI0008B6E299|nr:MipA/OmpV family protein [Sphingobium sp. YR768]SEQ99153.1 outer membrane protein [Sphingobium sp. YR768]